MLGVRIVPLHGLNDITNHHLFVERVFVKMRYTSHLEIEWTLASKFTGCMDRFGL